MNVNNQQNTTTMKHLVVSFRVADNGWVFVSGFALHNAQFKGQMLMAKLINLIFQTLRTD